MAVKFPVAEYASHGGDRAALYLKEEEYRNRDRCLNRAEDDKPQRIAAHRESIITDSLAQGLR